MFGRYSLGFSVCQSAPSLLSFFFIQICSIETSHTEDTLRTTYDISPKDILLQVIGLPAVHTLHAQQQQAFETAAEKRR